MKRFVTAYINFFDNELNQAVVEARDELHAVQIALDVDPANNKEFTEDDIEYFSNLENLYNYAANSDSAVSVIEI